MDENSLASSLELYKSQLSQVEQALQAAGNNTELLQLQKDLQELVSLTEEGLLSLKKSNILQSLEKNQKSEESDDYDAEYAAFQAAIAADDTESSDVPAHSSTSGSAPNSLINENPEKCDQSDPYEQFQEIIGTRCRAPYVHDWGASSYYNAIITSLKKSESDDEMPKAVVMFCNPTHAGMLPCEYHLEGRCRFSDDSCRYSHGCVVDLEDLNEFIDPDYSSLKVGSLCLACYHDDLWYRATIVDVLDNHQFMVMFDNYDETATLDLKDILPLDAGGDSDLSSDENMEDGAEDRPLMSEPVSDDEIDALPVFLWRPPKTTQALGDWETHTKGIGSKLMAKMGYIVGQGLGKSGQGRAEPVPIQLIPQGKSLDKIMELKELAGDQDLFDVMKRQKKRKDKQNKKNENISKPSAENHNVFDFINRKLGGKKGNVKDLIPKHHHDNKPNKQANKNISEQELNTRSDRNLNVQILKTHEEIKNVEKELYRLKKSLARNENKEKKFADKIRSKINSTEEYLQKLRTSEQTIQSHKKKRSDHKKLTIF